MAQGPQPGDRGDIDAADRDFMRRHGFVAYCDRVLLPALQRAGTDGLDERRNSALRAAVARVLQGLDDVRLGDITRGRAGPIALCLGMGQAFDELAASLLVRVLRAQGIDARQLRALEDLDALPTYGIARSAVSAVCLVTLAASASREQGLAQAEAVRWLLPQAAAFGLLLPGRARRAERLPAAYLLDGVATSFADAERMMASPLSRLTPPMA